MTDADRNDARTTGTAAGRTAGPLAELRRLFEAEEGLTCTLSDALGRSSAMDASVRAMWPGARLLGRAVTARPSGTDLSAVFEAIDLAGPGDVIAIAGLGSREVAFWGENTSLSARNRGAEGVVLDAPCRDVDAHGRIGFPVFATGAVPRAAAFGSRGETQIPVSLAGAVVRPGDVLAADANGVVVIPAERLAEVTAALPRMLERERAMQEALARGGTIGALLADRNAG